MLDITVLLFSLALCFWTMYSRYLKCLFYIPRYVSRLQNAWIGICDIWLTIFSQ